MDKMINLRNIIYSKYGKLSIIILFITVFICQFSIVTTAEGVSFEKAVESGLENNYELQEKLEVVKSIERDRNLLEAGVDWYLGIDGNYLYDSERIEDYQIIEEGDYVVLDYQINEKGDKIELVLEGGKTTVNGLSISSKLSLADNDPFEFENLEEKYKYSLDLSKRLYPIVPTETEKSFIQTDNRLIIAEAELVLARKNKEVDWLESYYNIMGLSERLRYRELKYQLVLRELKRIKAQREIGEAGEEQLLMAEINVKEADLQKKQLESSYVQSRDDLILELGINEDISLEGDSSYLKRFEKRVNSFNINISENEKDRLLKKNNPQLREIMFDKDYAENEFKWQLKEDDIEINTFGNYNYDAYLPAGYEDYWQLGVGISYDFYDGGQQELTIEGIRKKIVSLENGYNYTLKQLKQELRGMYSQYSIDKMNLAAKEIALEKSRLEEKLYLEQYRKGLINKPQYKEKEIALKEARLDYKEAGNTLMFTKARIVLFLGLY